MRSIAHDGLPLHRQNHEDVVYDIAERMHPRLPAGSDVRAPFGDDADRMAEKDPRLAPSRPVPSGLRFHPGEPSEGPPVHSAAQIYVDHQ